MKLCRPTVFLLLTMAAVLIFAQGVFAMQPRPNDFKTINVKKQETQPIIRSQAVPQKKPQSSTGFVFYVYDFYDAAKTDSQVIADCLKFCSVFKERVIVFDRKDWHIDEAILLPSNTTVIIDGCTIKQNNGVFDNVFRGNNLAINPDDPYGYPLSISDLSNIKILGKNGAKITGCDVNKKAFHPALNNMQDMVGDYWGWRTLQVSLTKCDGFEVGGIEFTQTRCWALSFDKCVNGYVHDLSITSNVKNGDGVDFRAGCHNCRVENITGYTSDDSVACTALPGSSKYPSGNYIYPMEPSRFLNPTLSPRDLDIHDISIDGIYTGGNHHSVICLAADGLRVYNINITNIEEDTHGSRESTVRIYTGYGSGYVDNDLSNIRVNNVISKIAGFAILCNTKVDNIWFNKIIQKNKAGKLSNISNPDGITITNSCLR
jgi:hypothetical protein